MFDYETLRIIWWLLLGVLLIGFAITDGFDLGVSALLRVLAKTDHERRALLETIEPVWEGNQVWLSLARERSSRRGRCCTQPRSRVSISRCCSPCSHSSCGQSVSIFATRSPIHAGAEPGTGY